MKKYVLYLSVFLLLQACNQGPQSPDTTTTSTSNSGSATTTSQAQTYVPMIMTDPNDAAAAECLAYVALCAADIDPTSLNNQVLATVKETGLTWSTNPGDNLPPQPETLISSSRGSWNNCFAEYFCGSDSSGNITFRCWSKLYTCDNKQSAWASKKTSDIAGITNCLNCQF